MELAISKASLEILMKSRGDLHHHKVEGDSAWLKAFYDELQKTVHQINFRPQHILDIGSGLGALDVCFAKSFGSEVTMVDGEHGDGDMHKHAQPWCSRHAVEQFWLDNGIAPGGYRYLNPDQLGRADPIYDLVISTRSWCFHYPPEKYLDYVLKHSTAMTMILVDLRRDRPAWRERMRACFEEHEILEAEIKFNRMMYLGRGRLQ